MGGYLSPVCAAPVIPEIYKEQRFLTVWEAGKLGYRASSWRGLSRCATERELANGVTFLLLIKPITHYGGPVLGLSFNPNCVPKASPSNSISLWIWALNFQLNDRLKP